MMANTCQYCATEIDNGSTCGWCNEIIQDANCNGIYLADAARAVSKRDDLSTPEERRTEIQAKYDLYMGR